MQSLNVVFLKRNFFICVHFDIYPWIVHSTPMAVGRPYSSRTLGEKCKRQIEVRGRWEKM